jgi:hypothetical protein
MKMDLEDVECDAEENLEKMWGLMRALKTIAFRTNALYILLVVRTIYSAFLHFKVRENERQVYEEVNLRYT